jgi:hypothetical protein
MTENFTTETIQNGNERVITGYNSSGDLIGIFTLDDVLREARENMHDFLRTFKATVCNEPDEPYFDLKHPDPETGHAEWRHHETAAFMVNGYRIAARELGLLGLCNLPAPTTLSENQENPHSIDIHESVSLPKKIDSRCSGNRER